MENVEIVLRSVASNKWCYIIAQIDKNGNSKPFCLLPLETDIQTIYNLAQLASNALGQTEKSLQHQPD